MQPAFTCVFKGPALQRQKQKPRETGRRREDGKELWRGDDEPTKEVLVGESIEDPNSHLPHTRIVKKIYR